MGARALREAPEFARVRAFLNFEAVGTNGPPRLFQAGPGNSWLTAAWAASAPRPVRIVAVHRDLPPAPERHGLLGARSRPGRPASTSRRPATRSPITPGWTRRRASSRPRSSDWATRRSASSRRSTASTSASDRRVTGRTSTWPGGRRSRTRAAPRASSPRSCSCWDCWPRSSRSWPPAPKSARSGCWSPARGRCSARACCSARSARAARCCRPARRCSQPWYAQANVFLVFLVSVACGAVWLVVLLGTGAAGDGRSVRPSVVRVGADAAGLGGAARVPAADGARRRLPVRVPAARGRRPRAGAADPIGWPRAAG